MITSQIAEFIARMHVASSKNIYTVKVSFTKVNLRLLVLFNIEGFIEGILVFLKYNFLNSFLLFKHIKLFSLPSRKVYWSLNKLSKNFFYYNFSGVFILSSSKGFITSSDSLLKYHSSGE